MSAAIEDYYLNREQITGDKCSDRVIHLQNIYLPNKNPYFTVVACVNKS